MDSFVRVSTSNYQQDTFWNPSPNNGNIRKIDHETDLVSPTATNDVATSTRRGHSKPVSQKIVNKEQLENHIRQPSLMLTKTIVNTSIESATMDVVTPVGYEPKDDREGSDTGRQTAKSATTTTTLASKTGGNTSNKTTLSTTPITTKNETATQQSNTSHTAISLPILGSADMSTNSDSENRTISILPHFSNETDIAIRSLAFSSNQTKKDALSSFSCEHASCILIFFHIPKTGGTTLYESFRRLAGITEKKKRDIIEATVPIFNNPTTADQQQQRRHFRYRRSKVGRDREDLLAEIDARVLQLASDSSPSTNNDNNNQTIYVYEFHAGSNPSFASLVQPHDNSTTIGQLQSWKDMGRRHNFTVFAFTILREPISWSLSAYFMVCIKQNTCKRIPPGRIAAKKYGNMTKFQNLEYTTRPNPQCAFLLRGGYPYHYKNKFVPTEHDCSSSLWSLLQDSMDWVGRLEAYEASIMDIVRKITGLASLNTIVAKVANNTNSIHIKNKIHRYELFNTSTEQVLVERNALDTILYQRIQEYYRLD